MSDIVDCYRKLYGVAKAKEQRVSTVVSVQYVDNTVETAVTARDWTPEYADNELIYRGKRITTPFGSHLSPVKLPTSTIYGVTVEQLTKGSPLYDLITPKAYPCVAISGHTADEPSIVLSELAENYRDLTSHLLNF